MKTDYLFTGIAHLEVLNGLFGARHKMYLNIKLDKT